MDILDELEQYGYTVEVGFTATLGWPWVTASVRKDGFSWVVGKHSIGEVAAQLRADLAHLLVTPPSGNSHG